VRPRGPSPFSIACWKAGEPFCPAGLIGLPFSQRARYRADDWATGKRISWTAMDVVRAFRRQLDRFRNAGGGARRRKAAGKNAVVAVDGERPRARRLPGPGVLKQARKGRGPAAKGAAGALGAGNSPESHRGGWAAGRRRFRFSGVGPGHHRAESRSERTRGEGRL